VIRAAIRVFCGALLPALATGSFGAVLSTITLHTFPFFEVAFLAGFIIGLLVQFGLMVIRFFNLRNSQEVSANLLH
jgi:hypothetical protein